MIDRKYGDRETGIAFSTAGRTARERADAGASGRTSLRCPWRHRPCSVCPSRSDGISGARV